MAEMNSQINLTLDAKGVSSGVGDAKRAINSLGFAVADANTKSSKSIDDYIKKLNLQNAVYGKSSREATLYKLALKGASDAQLNAADSSLKLARNLELKSQVVDGLKARFAALSIAALAAGAAFAYSVRQTINFDDKLNDLSKSTGVAVTDLAGLSLLAQQSGTDLDGIAKAIGTLSKNIGQDPEKFRQLGISAKEPIEAFKQLADILVLIEDEQTRAAIASQALGRDWRSLAPALLAGGNAIGATVERGKQLSGVTLEGAQNADLLNDRLAELNLISQRLNRSIANSLVPALTEITKAITLAYEESGLLQAAWVALGGLGAFLFTDEFSSATSKIKNLKKEIEELQKALAMPFAQRLIQKWTTKSDEELLAEIQRKQQTLRSLEEQLAKAVSPQPKPSKSPQQLAAEEKAKRDAESRARLFLKDGKATSASSITSEQSARLNADIDKIKQNFAAVTEAYANGEKILQALRTAGLTNEADYYASKLLFIQLNEKAEEESLANQISRLEEEKKLLTGAAAIEAQRKIEEAQAKQIKNSEDAKTATITNSLQQTAAINAVAQSYEEATNAANEYLKAIKLQNERELAGIGQGNAFRTFQEGLQGIDDKRIADEMQAARDKRLGKLTEDAYRNYINLARETYKQEVAEYIDRTQKILAEQGKWERGASEAFNNYLDEVNNVARSSENLFTNAFKSMEDALVTFVTTGKLNFSSLANSIINDLVRIQVQQKIIAPLTRFLNFGNFLNPLSLGSNPSGFNGTLNNPSAFVASAKGSAWDKGIQKFASGGLVTRRTAFAHGGGLGIMGESGPEAILPLSRGANGKLGVQSAGGGVVVNIVEAPGQGGQQYRAMRNGVDTLTIMVEQIKNSIAGDISRGSGAIPAAMTRTYGVNRAAGAY